jgi:hypothetical protein
LLAIAALQEEAVKQLVNAASADGSGGSRSRSGSSATGQSAVSDALDRVGKAFSGLFASKAKKEQQQATKITEEAAAATATASTPASKQVHHHPLGISSPSVKEVEGFVSVAAGGQSELEITYNYEQNSSSSTTDDEQQQLIALLRDQILPLLHRGGSEPAFYRAKIGGAGAPGSTGGGPSGDDDEGAAVTASPYDDDDDETTAAGGASSAKRSTRTTATPLVLTMETLFDTSNAFIVNEELLNKLKETVVVTTGAGDDAADEDSVAYSERLWVEKFSEATKKAAKSIRFLSGIPEPKEGGGSSNNHHDSVHHGDDDDSAHRAAGMPPLHSKVTAENAPKSALGMLELLTKEAKETMKDAEALQNLDRGLQLMRVYAQRSKLSSGALEHRLAIATTAATGPTGGSSSSASSSSASTAAAWHLFSSSLASAVRTDKLYQQTMEKEQAQRKAVQEKAQQVAAYTMAAALNGNNSDAQPMTEKQRTQKAEQQAKQAFDETIRSANLPPQLQPPLLALHRPLPPGSGGLSGPSISPLSLLAPLLVMPSPVSVSILVGAVALSHPALQAVLARPESVAKPWKKALKAESSSSSSSEEAAAASPALAIVASPSAPTPTAGSVAAGSEAGEIRWRSRVTPTDGGASGSGGWRSSVVPLALSFASPPVEGTPMAVSPSVALATANSASLAATGSPSSPPLPPALASLYQQIKWIETASLPYNKRSPTESFVLPSSLVREALAQAKGSSSSAAAEEAFRLFVLLRPCGPALAPSEQQLFSLLFSASSPYQPSPLTMFSPPALWREVLISADIDATFPSNSAATTAETAPAVPVVAADNAAPTAAAASATPISTAI